MEIYVAAPWGNIEGVYNRMKPFLDRGAITGLFDLSKPDYGEDERAWRLNYTVHHRAIMTVEAVAARLRLRAETLRRHQALPKAG
jgi:hypothetical protein